MRHALFYGAALFAACATAQNAADWKSYVLGPSSRTVLPVGILKQSADGVTNADALVGKSSDAARISTGSSQVGWPAGSSAAASSTHAGNAGNGDGARTYDAKNAIDGSSATFWNDDTEGDAAGPDTLTITAASAVTAGGVTIVSSPDGFIQDFTIETSTDGRIWTKQAGVTDNNNVAPSVAFGAPTVTFTQLRVTVTRNHNAGKLVYTRIAEVVLGSWTGDAAWPAQTTATGSSEHPPATESSYAASNAVDGNPATFWNDNTESQFPDVLTITSGQAVVIPGITIVSNSDGAPTDLTVETSLDSKTWTTQATIKGNSDTTIPVPFPSPVGAKSFRITVTNAQNTGKGVFTRVAEVVPGVRQAAPYIDLDFGKVVAGRLQLNIKAASDPAPQLRLAFSETQQYLGFSSDYSPSDYSTKRGTDDFVPSPGGGSWVDKKACQFDDNTVCSDGLRGFRYVRLFIGQTPGAEAHSSSTGWVDISPSGVSLNFTAYLGTPDTYRGHFMSSDDLLNKIWYGAVYTIELNTDTFTADTVDPRNAFSASLDGKTVLHDGAKRDRDPYVGDIAVQLLIDMVSHADGVGARNVLLDLAQHQRADGWMPPASISNYALSLFDYPAWWAIASGDFVLYTGDKDFATQIWDALKKLVDTWYPSVTNSAGLLDKSGSWSGYGDYAFLPRQGVITYYNANYIRALRGAAVIAKFLGHTDEASSWSARADSTSAALAQSDLWDASAGAWRDSLSGNTNGCHSQDATAFAILSNSSSSDRSSASLSFLSKTLKRDWGNAFVDQDCFGGGTSDRVYNFISHPEVMARFQVNDDMGALELLRRSWGWQVTRDPENTFWEGVGTSGDVAAYEGSFSSMAHGWASGAAVALSTRVLGVEPTSPGFATFDVIPHPGDLTWANGTVPTPRGDIIVGWEVVDGQLKLNVQGPPNTLARARIPVASASSRRRDARPREVLLNGATVWHESGARIGRRVVSYDGDYVFIYGLAPGKHTIVSR